MAWYVWYAPVRCGTALKQHSLLEDGSAVTGRQKKDKRGLGRWKGKGRRRSAFGIRCSVLSREHFVTYRSGSR